MKQIERTVHNSKKLSDRQLLDRARRFFASPEDHTVDIIVARGLSLNAMNTIYNLDEKLTLEGVRKFIRKVDSQPVPTVRLIKEDIDHLPDADLIKKLLKIKNCGLVTAQELVAFCKASGLI